MMSADMCSIISWLCLNQHRVTESFNTKSIRVCDYAERLVKAELLEQI